MTNIKRPNLFSFATKELSQDAFIVWLLQWASPGLEIYDPLLSNCSREFLKKLLALQLESPSEITLVEAGRQWKNIDVWAEVNGKYLLIIEDKDFAGEHSGQLKRYKQLANEWCIEKGYELACVYLKTGSESVSILNQVREQGFAIFGRRDFLEILKKFDVQNHIFMDFKERLQVMEDDETHFLLKPIKDWGDPDWKGFYQCLEKARPLVKWEHVHSISGGFWNAILNWHEVDDCCPYMQIEQGLLCFKVGEIRENRSEIRNQYHNRLMAVSKEMPEIQKPGRFGFGLYMTIAVVDRAIWLGPDDSVVDMDKVVIRLNQYEATYLRMIENLGSETSVISET